MTARRRTPRRFLPHVCMAVTVVVAGLSAAPDEVTAQASRATGSYDVTDLGALETTGSVGPEAIDAAGWVAGSATLGTSHHAVVHDGTTLHDLGVPPGYTNSAALDLNDAGQAVGRATSSNEVESRAVLFSDSGPVDLGDLGGDWAVALAINTDGVVVGSSTTADGSRHGFRWQDGQMVDLNDVLPVPSGARIEDAVDIDDTGQMIGRLKLPSGELVGYHFDGTALHPIADPPGTFTNVVAFNSSTVVGVTGSDAFTWSEGTLTPLRPVPGDHCSRASGIDRHGRAVGASHGCGRGPDRAVLWQDGRPTELQVLLAPDGPWRLTGASAINERGQIAATALDPGGYSHGVVLTPRHRATSIPGLDGTATSIAAAAALPPAFGEPTAAVLVSGSSPADVAVAATLAARRRAPLLLIGPRGLDDRVVEAVQRHTPSGGAVVIVGGTKAVSPLIEQHMASLDHPTERYSGADRFETAARVAEAAGGTAGVVLVAGNAIDTPSAIPVAVPRSWALLFTSGRELPAATAAFLASRPGSPVVGIGRAAAAPGVTEPIAGPHRIATSVAVAERFFPSPVAIVLASAAHAVDGGVAGRLAASAGAPVVLSGTRLDPEVAELISTRPLLSGALVVGTLASSGVGAEIDPLLR
ncbi:MAG: cell wall-binding repeat-containing protein [Acidimicrobiia bacterium]|nr:cell wall-binding repeat-containing protein [Acidimicrobiia bacterium]